MELKCVHLGVKLLHKCFNRTFMELKCPFAKLDDETKLCFNRTFMELK